MTCRFVDKYHVYPDCKLYWLVTSLHSCCGCAVIKCNKPGEQKEKKYKVWRIKEKKLL